MHSEGQTGTILVVDDEQRNRTLVRSVLEREHRILEAASGPEALALLQGDGARGDGVRGDIDLVLLDVMMPDMDGFQVLNRIRAVNRPDFLPVLLLTALGDQEHRVRALELGANDFLAKPFDRAELTLRVGHFLELRRQRATIATQMLKLQELSVLKDDLVSLIVHDLRNPLSGILGFLHMFASELPDPELRQDAAHALQAADKLRETLDDMLQVRLLEEGKLTPERTPTEVIEILRAAAVSVEGTARLRRIGVQIQCEPDLRAALDAHLVRRALENLVTNAVRYSPPDGVVEVGARQRDGALILSVSDRGDGLGDEIRKQLFERFGGVHRKHDSGRKGFGLGLYFVRLAAEAHGGGVTSRDREGGGTTFELALEIPQSAAA